MEACAKTRVHDIEALHGGHQHDMSSKVQIMETHKHDMSSNLDKMETHEHDMSTKVEKLETHKHSQEGTTFLRTCFNGINTMTGIGILSVPYALSEGGWLSLLLLFVMAIILCYTGLLMCRCMDMHSRIRSYPDIGELAFGYKGRVVVAIFLYLELYMIAVEFLILEGYNLQKLFPNMSFKAAGLQIGGKGGFILISAAIILPTTWLKNLSMLSYVSAGGVLASVVIVCSVLWAGAIDGVGFHEKGRLLNLKGMHTTLSLYAFCYCGHTVFPTIYTSMSDRTQFYKVLILCFVLCTFNYGSMAVMAYLMYGDDVDSQVTLNLPIRKLSSKIAIIITVISPFTKYALVVTPIVVAVEEWFPYYKNRFFSILLRTLLVASTVVVALLFPFFGYLLALMGSFLSTAVSMLLPCLCYLKIFKSSRSFGCELVIIIGILTLSIYIAVVGTSSSLLQIVHHL